ncbi:hypothetical protein LXM94_16620 [Rhizobium sp. TRM95111]|uniref:hypothetical protein n=1 Tax=Rhizobium alarense TaxID=2846851 RepID=UPI001F44FE7C|nr:hypothetical protein [Rhizobium alarense]MCF3641598.1 hypothetical protein [Rhizobium alarense]
MRGATGNGVRVLEDARIRRAALFAANAGNGLLPEYGSDAPLFQRVATSLRLQRRLFERLTGTAGDPADADADLRQFLLLSEKSRQVAAVCAGLTYHLNALGAVLDRVTIGKLSNVFGKNAVRFAVAHAALSPVTIAVLDFNHQETERIVRADGGHILSLWMVHRGLAELWRPPLDGMDAPASAALVRSAAIEIGTAVAAFIQVVDR